MTIAPVFFLLLFGFIPTYYDKIEFNLRGFIYFLFSDLWARPWAVICGHTTGDPAAKESLQNFQKNFGQANYFLLAASMKFNLIASKGVF